jgi:cytochrome c553
VPPTVLPRFGTVAAVGCLTCVLGWHVTVAADDAPKAKTEVEADHAAKRAKGLAIFQKDVRQVLIQHCLRCHGGDETESEFDITDRDRLLKGGLKGAAVVSGKSRESLLFKLISHQKKPHMPAEADKLPDAVIARIAEWIDLGAPFDASLTATPDGTAAWTRKVVSDDVRQHWAYQPLRRVDPPAVKNQTWCRTPIDRFILAKQEAAGIQPNPPATKIQLLRRAYFDLIGLPPSPADVEASLNDSSPDAFDKVLDKLLANPAYGERWARHWLDLSRFGESHGFEHDYDRPTAFHFRDFVIKALNMDLPYDQFVKWQLAGDEYEPQNHLAMMATGYLAAGVHSTQITANEVEKHRYDEMDDMLATIGTSMLGLTFGCARCHDHKFDAIPQADYYRMLTTFTTTVRSELDLDTDPAGYAKAKAAFDAEHAPFVAALQKYEAEQLPGQFKTWDETRRTNPSLAVPQWILAEPAKLTSAGGATFAKQPDGSYLVSGKNVNNDTYTFVVETELKGITAIRLEALSDPSLAKGGPGRADNGNFALSDLTVTSAPKSDPSAAKPVKLKNARATFEQKGLPVAAVIDDNPQSAWAVDPEFGKNHAAAFDLAEPVGTNGPTVLTFTLKFNNNTKHAIGRPRLSLTTSPVPLELQGPSTPQAIQLALDLPADKRSAEQTASLLKWFGPLDAGWTKLNDELQAHAAKAPKPALAKALISSEGTPAVRLHTQGGDFLNETHFLRRGDTSMKEGVAAQGFLQVLMPGPDAEKRWQLPPPTGSKTSFRRTALAEWLTDVDRGAGKLLARVIVNRLWQHHLGTGLVATPSDFGVRGEKPTHPELLDWLATELIRSGWRLKPLHKLILTSAVVQQSSGWSEANAAVDRDNKLIWRLPSSRLEAEVIRDSILSVTGTLDATMFGPGTLDEASRRRSIYFTVKRSKLIPMMTVFDAPDALSGLPERAETTIAPQALMLLNNPQIRQHSGNFAKRIAGTASDSLDVTIRSAYLTALGRPPSADEAADSVAFVTQQIASYSTAGKPDARELALTDFCQALLCLNEFVYVE